MKGNDQARRLVGYGAAKAVPGLVMAGSIPTWTVVFGPGAYAGYSIIWSVANLATVLLTGWVTQAELRFAGGPLRAASMPKATMPLLACGAVVLTTLILWVVGLVLPGGLSWGGILLGAALAGVTADYLVRLTSAQRENAARTVALAESARAALALVLSLLLHAAVPGLDGAEAIVLAFVLATVIADVLARRGARSPRAQTPGGTDVVRAFWSYGWPMTLWLTGASLLTYVDRFTLYYFLGSERAGSYAAVADLIVRGLAMVAFPVTMLAHPEIMTAWNNHDQRGALRKVRSYLRGLVIVVAVVSVTGTAVILLLGPMVGDLVIPQPWAVPLLFTAAGLWQVALIAHKPLEMMDRTRWLAAMLLAATSASVIGSFLLAPAFGELGAALAFAAGASLYVGAVLLKSRTSVAHMSEPIEKVTS